MTSSSGLYSELEPCCVMAEAESPSVMTLLCCIRFEFLTIIPNAAMPSDWNMRLFLIKFLALIFSYSAVGASASFLLVVIFVIVDLTGIGTVLVSLVVAWFTCLACWTS